MYNVNTERINDILIYLTNELLPTISQIMDKVEGEFLSDPTAGFAAERLFHTFIEGMTDIGNLLIDGFIMRDPGSYEDIVDIMEDEQVYSPAHAQAFKEIVKMRKGLVVEYTLNRRTQLYHAYQKHHDNMKEYPHIIREYLKKELW